MSKIIISCQDQELEIKESGTIASGGVNEVTAVFEFCEKWTNYVKTAVFYNKKEEVYHKLLVNDECTIPWEVLAKRGILYIGVFGVKDGVTRTSGMVKLKITEGAITADTAVHEPSPDVYAQIINKHYGVHIGSEEPMDENVMAWIDPEGEPTEITAGIVAITIDEVVRDGCKVYRANFEMIDESVHSAEFTVPQGDPGKPGPGIASVIGNEDGSWTFTYEDGKEETVSNEAYVALTEKMDAISMEIADKQQITPDFAESEEWLKANGDTSKLYVLPDGYIYAYIRSTEEVSETIDLNLQSGKIDNQTGELVTDALHNYLYSDMIAIDKGKTYRLTITDATCTVKICYYDVSGNFISCTSDNVLQAGNSGVLGTASGDVPMLNGAAYFRVRFYCNWVAKDDYTDSVALTVANSVLTWEEMGDTPYAWKNTGHAFVPADYEDRIIDLEDAVKTLKGDIPIYGIVDSENDILMTGSLVSGTYTLKYLHEDGTTTEIGAFTME